MLAGLFEEDGGAEVSGTNNSKVNIPAPPRPRLHCGFAGISNQGATCYLNSLLQTLLFTPEFRESLFHLDENDLGSLDKKDLPGQKVRVIPIQVQRLFARMLLSDQQSVPTVNLTESFGWTNNEELQQHDVQELNRILFSAIEDSLVGTAGHDLIKRLYHGTVVNKIICKECGHVSEREEDFLDLTVTVAGSPGLENSLCESYCEMESMDGNNQYRCETCAKLVDAEKGARIRCLPEILTISLLRFSFDFVKMQRYKESGKFVFPMTLDMAPFYEEECDPQQYELFSVVIHKGGAYGGHYHAFIRDVDSLGKWTHPEEETIQLPMDPGTGEVDFIECDNPVDLIQTILKRSKDKAMTVDKLCGEITKETGVSWNKRFKRHYGTIHRFLLKNGDVFTLDQSTHILTLKESDPSMTESKPSEDNVGGSTSDRSPKETPNKRPLSPPPLPGHCWFDFDDSRVHPIREKDIQKNFSGKASAYMLFYRKTSLVRPPEAQGDPFYGIPEKLLSEVLQENEELRMKREEYEIEINKVKVQVHQADSYKYNHGALHALYDDSSYTELALDRRKTVSDLRTAIMELGGNLVEGNFKIHKMKELPAGFHLYDEVKDDDKKLMEIPVCNGDMLFIWNGEKVWEDLVPTGESCEPVYLSVIYSNTGNMSWGYAKNLTLDELKMMVSMLVEIPVQNIQLKRVSESGDTSKVVAFSANDHGKTLQELKLCDGDKLLVDDKTADSDISGSLLVTNTKMFLFVELRSEEIATCKESRQSTRLEVDKSDTIGELKMLAVTKFDVCDIRDGGRLRVDHDTLGLRPPLHEELTVQDAALTQGTSLVLEPGPSPETNEITLTFTPGNPGGDLPDQEVIVDRNITVDQCLQCMINRAGFTDDNWHLRKTNWCGEAAEVLDDLDLKLEQCLINDGDHILLQEGRLPPKGYVRLTVLLYPPPKKLLANQSQEGVLNWITKSIHDLLQPDSTAKPGEATLSNTLEPLNIGEVEMSLQDSLEELQLMIQTMPLLSEIQLPTPAFVRVRLIEDGKLGPILRGQNQPLQKLKLKSCSKIGVQILPEEENLNLNQIILQIQRRVQETRTYDTPQEITWDVSQGATVTSLKKLVADVMFIPLEFLLMAKHFHKRFEWMILREQQQHQKKNQGKGKKKGGHKTNLRQSPFFIHDGDIIGVKNLQFGHVNRDDFGTYEDDLGKKELAKLAEEKKKERDMKKKRQEEFGAFERQRRPEVALTIKVDDFR